MLSQLHCESTPHRPFLMAGGIRRHTLWRGCSWQPKGSSSPDADACSLYSRGPPAGIRWYFLEPGAVPALPFDRHPQKGRWDRRGAIARILIVEQGFQLSLEVVLAAIPCCRLERIHRRPVVAPELGH
jgi:hypothetical protein